ncbi:MAG: DUF481 domain-containing protein [Gammaproteobacteria bacterium]|nr:DUF481 domain-containing protein [Gammaproteobacteria bacterium]
MRTTLLAIALSVTGLLPAAVTADEMIMKNGSRLIGTVVSASEGKIKFDTEFAGTISIDVEDVDTMFTDKEVTVMMNDGQIIENQRIAARDKAMIMMSENMGAVLFKAKDMKSLNPEPWELGRGYKWFGDISTAMLVERGNTDTKELDVSGKSIWRSLKDRYTIRANYELDEANGEKNKNKWRWRNKYDRFSTENPDKYIGALVAFEGDEFADLDLRTYVGPYIGRQFFEGNFLTLSGEVGLVYVDERFDVGENNSYPGSNWALHLTSNYFGGSSNFYIDHDGILNFEETDALILNTTIGIKFKVYGGVEAGVEFKYEYDGGVAKEVDELDETYNFRLGYAW